MALQGTIDTFELPDVLRLLATSRKTGCLTVDGDRGVGQIWVEDGELVGSRLDLGDHPSTGSTEITEGIFQVLRFVSGDFTFVADDDGADKVPSSSSGSANVDDTISSSSAMLDELAGINEQVPGIESWATLRPELDADGVTLGSEQWRVLASIGDGTTIAGIASAFSFGELDALRRINDLVGEGVVTISEAPAAVVAAPVDDDIETLVAETTGSETSDESAFEQDVFDAADPSEQDVFVAADDSFAVADVHEADDPLAPVADVPEADDPFAPVAVDAPAVDDPFAPVAVDAPVVDDPFAPVAVDAPVVDDPFAPAAVEVAAEEVLPEPVAGGVFGGDIFGDVNPDPVAEVAEEWAVNDSAEASAEWPAAPMTSDAVDVDAPWSTTQTSDLPPPPAPDSFIDQIGASADVETSHLPPPPALDGFGADYEPAAAAAVDGLDHSTDNAAFNTEESPALSELPAPPAPASFVSPDEDADLQEPAAGEPSETNSMARQLASLSPAAARAVAQAARADDPVERDAALAEAEAEDKSVDRSLLLRFLGK